MINKWAGHQLTKLLFVCLILLLSVSILQMPCKQPLYTKELLEKKPELR